MGITRQVVLDIVRQEFNITVRNIDYASLLSADEVFLTSTTKEVLPVVQIDSHIIGNGQPGPKTRRVHELFSEYVKSLVRHKEVA